MTMPSGMFLRVEPQSSVPIYRQIVEQVRMAVAGGRLRVDERLPGVRELADELSINLQTVQKAYAELVRDGTLEQRRGTGTFVAPHTAKAKSSIGKNALEERVRQLVRDARTAGMKRDELAKFVNDLWAEEK
jgi:GntR family transcriptional regulator